MAVAVLTCWFKLLGFQVMARGGACTREDVGAMLWWVGWWGAVPCRVWGGLQRETSLLEVGVGGVIQALNSDTEVSGGTLHSVTLGRQRAFSGEGFCLARSSPGPLLNCPQRGRGWAWGSSRGRGCECGGDPTEGEMDASVLGPWPRV